MKHLFVTATVLLLCAPGAAFAWGGAGHSSVAAIAEAYLAPKARATIEKYLGGRSIVEFASWMDEVRDTPKYKYTSRWHAAPVDAEFKHTPAVARKGGDAITATEESFAALRNYKSLPKETVAFHLKILVHAIGDWHCPVHVKYTTIETNFQVFLNGEKVSYHSVWDGAVVDPHKRGYLEWLRSRRLDRLPAEKIREITAGTPRDWFHQTALDCRVIYDWVKPNAKLTGKAWREFLAKATPLAESQIQKAAFRLAVVLNECFNQ